MRLRVFGPGAAIEIGEGAQLSGTSVTARSQRISIGRQVLLAPNCVIVDSDFHALWPPEARATEPGLERDAPVSIGDYVWIGMNCLILKGVSIGEGAMIGAGSVVTRDVPPFCLAVGAPARVLRRLARRTPCPVQKAGEPEMDAGRGTPAGVGEYIAALLASAKMAARSPITACCPARNPCSRPAACPGRAPSAICWRSAASAFTAIRPWPRTTSAPGIPWWWQRPRPAAKA